MVENNHDPRETDAFHRGRQEADIQSLHYRMDEIKSMLQDYHTQHQKEVERLDAKLEERVRPLERFKNGVVYVSTFVGAVASVVAGLFTFKFGGKP